MKRVLPVLLLLLFGCHETISRPTMKPYTSGSSGWLLSAAEAKRRIESGATVLDARERGAYTLEHVNGARHVDWQKLSEPGDPIRGQILANTTLLTERLRALDISNGKQVIVVGDPVNGWGEDGRIVWLLRTLGHKQTALVDGGHFALKQIGLATTTETPPSGSGTISIERKLEWDISQADLLKLVQQSEFIGGRMGLVDTRERREYDGQTPYGESRGGHIPGAVHLHYKDLLNSHGFLRPREQILALLAKIGVTPDKPAVVYCTGGVRSGWLVAVMLDVGFGSVKNYAGSMWEWSAGDPALYPLEK